MPHVIAAVIIVGFFVVEFFCTHLFMNNPFVGLQNSEIAVEWSEKASAAMY